MLDILAVFIAVFIALHLGMHSAFIAIEIGGLADCQSKKDLRRMKIATVQVPSPANVATRPRLAPRAAEICSWCHGPGDNDTFSMCLLRYNALLNASRMYKPRCV